METNILVQMKEDDLRPVDLLLDQRVEELKL